MCIDEFPADDAADLPLNTDPASAPGVTAFNDLIRKLKCTSALAAGRLKRREYLRKYSASPRGKAVIQAYTERNRAKRNAYNKMRYARMRGELVNPGQCSACGGSNKVEAHHDDYAKPLAVRWLCRACHKTWHKLNGKALNG